MVRQPGLGDEYSGDNHRLLAEIPGFQFRSLDDSINSLYRWYLERKAEIDPAKVALRCMTQGVSMTVSEPILQQDSRSSGFRPCPVCRGIRSTLLYRQSFEQLSGARLLNGYDVVICHKCGAAFSDGIPEQQVFDQYYRDLSKYEQDHRPLKAAVETKISSTGRHHRTVHPHRRYPNPRNWQRVGSLAESPAGTRLPQSLRVRSFSRLRSRRQRNSTASLVSLRHGVLNSPSGSPIRVSGGLPV